MSAAPATAPTIRQLAIARAAAIVENWREQRFQKKHGTNEARREEMLQRVAQLPGGGKLLAEAERIGAPIRVESHRKMRDSFGVVARKHEDAVISATIANTGNPVAMARTACHELRHVLQLSDLGLAETGGGRRLHAVRTGHMISMMMEADAFTAETLAALQAARQGKPEYMQQFMEKDDSGPNMRHVRRFLNKRPFDSFDSDAAFARALFTDLMLNGIDNYSTGYFGNYREQFIYCNTLERFNAHIDSAAKIGNMKPSDARSSIYGPDFMRGASLDAMAHMFRAALPQEEQAVLRKIDSTVAGRHTFTEEQYQQRRREIVDKSYDIYMKEEYYWHAPGSAFGPAAKFLQAAAEVCTPPGVSDFKKKNQPEKRAAAGKPRKPATESGGGGAAGAAGVRIQKI